jgi:glycosyltransferase involved in cell wall biosynthesis
VENPLLFWLSRFRRLVCHIVSNLLRRFGFGEGFDWLDIRAFDRVLPEINCEARDISADLFIGHNPGLLPIAWKVARAAGAKSGFDMEDFHSGMTRFGEGRSLQDLIVRDWEKNHLFRYDYLTAAAPLIAQEYIQQHAVSFSAVVLNAFDPICCNQDSPGCDGGILSLYWVSQTIGKHRGLEDVVRALALLKETPVRMYLRGDWQIGYEATLRMMIDELRIPQDRIVSLPRVTFDEYVTSATRYDVGLAIEEPTSRNRELCVTNKMLMYLSAGLAIVATATPAQADFMGQIPKAGFVYPWGDHESLAGQLRVWTENRDLLGDAKDAARRAAREKFNWRHEQTKLEGVVEKVLQ